MIFGILVSGQPRGLSWLYVTANAVRKVAMLSECGEQNKWNALKNSFLVTETFH